MIPKRIVIDTNVCLDLFVFQDPRWARLRARMEHRELEVVTREDCRQEWLFVLHYAHLKLDETRRASVTKMFDALIQCHPIPLPDPDVHKLPVCKDKDDQKFLECARDSKAAVLITKDKALLKLARKTRREGLFEIMTPETWMATYENPLAESSVTTN
ncbi:putative toxin-antitoxin system toxin component, PIN family [Oxalicibacterium faecigallinarum]|nr:putative toxin-antitoxin system toxin component, PIN family [Oxalicibacterium faecigallinarum]